MQILQVLKSSTKHLHDRLERVSYAREIMTKELNVSQYYDLLWKNYLIYKDLEPRLNKGLTKVGQLFPQNFVSRRLKDIESDLSYFPNHKMRVISENKFKINKKNAAAWLGVLYVLEGSRLGGNVIVKALRNNPNLKSIPEFHFYEQKNVDIRKRWMTFQSSVQDTVIMEDNVSVTIEAANMTFDYFYQIHQQKLLSA